MLPRLLVRLLSPPMVTLAILHPELVEDPSKTVAVVTFNNCCNVTLTSPGSGAEFSYPTKEPLMDVYAAKEGRAL